MKKIFVLLAALAATSAYAAENCTAENKKAVCKTAVLETKVSEACKILETKGKAGLAEVKKMRFDCCGEPDYMWVQDMSPKMLMHPIKSQLDGQDLTNNADPDGKKLFVEFVKAVKAKPKGAWVDYKWTKLGESDPTPKTSWVAACNAKDEKEPWIVGSGTWK